MMNRSKWCLIGIPDHEAVMNVGGRIGAAAGPAAFRKNFAKLKGRDGVHESAADLGDVSGLSSDVAKNHRQAADVVRGASQAHKVSVIVGGGHDHGYSHLLGIHEALGGKARIGCINIDAHLDVRKPTTPVKITSGSPFYLALESGILSPKHFVEFGIQPHCNGKDLWDYVEGKGVEVVSYDKLRHDRTATVFRKTLKRLSRRCDAIVISMDLDAAAEAHAPGVSAPQAEGFSSSEMIEMAEIAAWDKKVISLGLFELNPEHDLSDRTARLAATAAYHFVAEAIKLRRL